LPAQFLTLDVKKLGIDLLSLNGSKIYGPKGIGMLYVKKGISLSPLIKGGGQEFGLRAGTENVPSIVGFAKALELAQSERELFSHKISQLRDKLIKGLLLIPDSKLNGPMVNRLPNNVNISFLKVEGESVLLRLDALGIYVSTGSACSAKSLEPSHVILSIYKGNLLAHEYAHGSIRFTLGNETTADDIDKVITATNYVVSDLRKLSSLK
jgi:cysteine desulfurase